MVQQPITVDQVRQPGEASIAGNVTCGVASIVVRQANRHRKEATFTNISDTRIDIAKSNLATLNAGIPVYPHGSIIIEPDASGRIYVGPISAITSAATKLLAFTEDW